MIDALLDLPDSEDTQVERAGVLSIEPCRDVPIGGRAAELGQRARVQDEAHKAILRPRSRLLASGSWYSGAFSRKALKFGWRRLSLR